MVAAFSHSKKWKFALLPDIYIHFEAFTSINTKQQEISLIEQSAVTITADEPIARNELFGHFYSFLIFFLLFVRKSPTTSRLSFDIQEKEVKLLGLPAKMEDSPFDILIMQEEIEHTPYLGPLVDIESIGSKVRCDQQSYPA